MRIAQKMNNLSRPGVQEASSLQRSFFFGGGGSARQMLFMVAAHPMGCHGGMMQVGQFV